MPLFLLFHPIPPGSAQEEKKKKKKKMRLGPKPRQSYERSESVTWRYQRRKDNSDLIRVLGFALDCPRGGQLAVWLVVMVEVVGVAVPRGKLAITESRCILSHMITDLARVQKNFVRAICSS